MAMTTAVEIPFSYRREVRDLHNILGVTIRETKRLTSSVFYFDKNTQDGYDLYLELRALADRIDARALAVAQHYARLAREEAREEARKKLACKNRWRMLTFRKPLAG